MKKFSNFVVNHKSLILIISFVLFILSIIGYINTKVNYDILVYLPKDNETIIGQDILNNDFNMGAYSVVIVDNLKQPKILELENKIKNVETVDKVVSIYDVIGDYPIDILPDDIKSKLHKDNTDILLITFKDSTSSESTLNAVKEIRSITKNTCRLGGMSSMVVDTMDLSNKEILIYIVIAVLLCIIVLELSLDSYLVPVLLLINIGLSIIYNLGSNVFLGQISYITKALVAVLQLGVTTDFSIFLYHSYEHKKKTIKDKASAMKSAIEETFKSVTGSSLTTVAGFLVLCAMELTLGKDLGIVMAKGVILGVISVLTIFPSLILFFDKYIEKTSHKVMIPKFNKINHLIVKYNKVFFITFLVLLIPFYLANKNVDVYYKIDTSLPDNLESIVANNELKDKYNIVSPEIILIDKNLKINDVNKMVDEISNIKGIDFVLSYSKIKELGLTENMLNDDINHLLVNDKYQVVLINSLYEVASDELNNQINVVNDIVKKYDPNSIVAGEGPLMKDLIKISDKDFNNVNTWSVVCIFIILFIVLKSFSLPILLISAIEFAIFINMGISYFAYDTLPFVAPIVLGTIQLGATIDYAILLTTTYLKNRNNNKDKYKCMEDTLNYCGSSILVSGLCFFAATFGVGVYSDLEMVGSLCTLISRGAIISMIVVICVLPSILLTFDKVISKTNINIKGGKNMKKISGLLIGLLATTVIPVNAASITKNEIVYSKLNTDGSINRTIVTDRIDNIDKLENITDYSDLKNIIDLSDNNSFELNNNKINWKSTGSSLLYQGETDKHLPIDVKITYKLDGKEANLDDLLGKSGHVDMSIKYINNDSHIKTINNTCTKLYTPFVVLMSTSFDNNSYNFKANNAKVISNGDKSMIVGISVPGLYESLNLSELKDMDKIDISFDTNNFSLPTIMNVSTSKLIDSDDLKIFDKLDELYKSIDELSTNMDKIEDGAKLVQNGSNTLKKELYKSINSMNNNSKDTLSETDINNILKQVEASTNAKFTDEYKNQIGDKAGKQAVNAAKKEIENNLNMLNNAGITATLVNTCETNPSVLPACSDPTTQAYIAKYKSLMYVKNYNEATNYKNIYDTAYKTAISATIEASKQTSETLVKTLVPEVANQVKNGTLDVVGSSLGELYTGVSKLDDGINDLTNGITKYNKDGIKKLNEVVNVTLKGNVDKIKATLELGDEYKTFTDSNDIDGNTKFILIVDGKSNKEETKEEVNQKQEKKSIFKRFIDLFKKNK